MAVSHALAKQGDTQTEHSCRSLKRKRRIAESTNAMLLAAALGLGGRKVSRTAPSLGAVLIESPTASFIVAGLSFTIGLAIQSLHQWAPRLFSGLHRRRARSVLTLLTNVLSTLFISAAPVLVWNGQTILSERRASDVVLDFTINESSKELTIQNEGAVAVMDIAIFLTDYRLTRDPLTIDSVSKVGPVPLWRRQRIEAGSSAKIDLPDVFKPFMPFYDGFPKVPDVAVLTNYVLRIRFTNEITKKRWVKYFFVGAIKRVPSLFDPTVAVGGGYASSAKVLALRKSIIENQEQLFDDDPIDQYRN